MESQAGPSLVLVGLGFPPGVLRGPLPPPPDTPRQQGWSRAGPALVLVGPDLVLKMRRKVRWNLRLVPAWSWLGAIGPDLVLEVTRISGYD